MFASVIVGVAPGAEATRAAEAGATIARAADCPLVLAHVASATAYVDERWLYDLSSSVCAPTVRKLVIRATDAARGLLDVQESHGDSLLCVASRGRVGLAAVALGSTTAAVLHETHRPVLVVGPAAAVPKQVRTIVAGYDGTDEGEAAATTAAVWAMLLTATLHIVRVSDPLAPWSTADLVAEHQALKTELSIGLGLRPVWDVVHHADPAAALVTYAGDVDASLLVLGHDEHRRAARVLGTTAARAVHDAACPVLIAHQPRQHQEA